MVTEQEAGFVGQAFIYRAMEAGSAKWVSDKLVTVVCDRPHSTGETIDWPR